VLGQARRQLGESYRGDADAPRVEIVSEPALGLSMDLPATDTATWATLAETARAIASRCDVYAIACNTLNVYTPRLDELSLGADLVSYPDAVRSWATRSGIERVGLLAARPVATLGPESPYRRLAEEIDVESPPDIESLHALIGAVKAEGGARNDLRDRFATLAAEYDSVDLLLACTELPLISRPVPGHRLVDVTDLVAEELVRRWRGLASE
jgi:aspartate racemase